MEEKIEVAAVSGTNNEVKKCEETDVKPTVELIGGKFRSVDALLSSYNNLEAEFSRRTARLKELEAVAAEAAGADRWEKRLNDFFAVYPFAREYGDAIGDYVGSHAELFADETCLEKALLAVLAERKNSSLGTITAAVGNLVNDKIGNTESKHENKQEAIKVETLAPNASEKKSAEIGVVTSPKLMSSGGGLPQLLPKRPKTLLEAGRLALEMLTKSIK